MCCAEPTDLKIASNNISEDTVLTLDMKLPDLTKPLTDQSLGQLSNSHFLLLLNFSSFPRSTRHRFVRIGQAFGLSIVFSGLRALIHLWNHLFLLIV